MISLPNFTELKPRCYSKTEMRPSAIIRSLAALLNDHGLGGKFAMMDLGIFLLFCLAALLVAWVVNAIVNVLSGEKRNDTGSLWIDIVLRIFAARDFGITARILNYLARQGWPLKLLYAMGAIALVAFFVHGCRD